MPYRDEREALHQRIEELEAELADAREKHASIEGLERDLAALREQRDRGARWRTAMVGAGVSLSLLTGAMLGVVVTRRAAPTRVLVVAPDDARQAPDEWQPLALPTRDQQPSCEATARWDVPAPPGMSFEDICRPTPCSPERYAGIWAECVACPMRYEGVYPKGEWVCDRRFAVGWAHVCDSYSRSYHQLWCRHRDPSK